MEKLQERLILTKGSWFHHVQLMGVIWWFLKLRVLKLWVYWNQRSCQLFYDLRNPPNWSDQVQYWWCYQWYCHCDKMLIEYLGYFFWGILSLVREFIRLTCFAWFSYANDAPATWPTVVPRILLRYENRSARQHWSSQYLPPIYLRSWLEFKLAGMPAVKLCDGSGCRRRMFSFVREVSQAVPAATSQAPRRYMRTRLK